MTLDMLTLRGSGRGWVVQEVFSLPPDQIVILAGSQIFDFRQFMEFLRLIINTFNASLSIQNWVGAQRPQSDALWNRRQTYCFEHLRSINRVRRHIELDVKDLPTGEDTEWEKILRLLYTMADYDFADPRDHIYGCLGLVELVLSRSLQQDLLVPNYTLTTRDVFTSTAALYYNNARELDFVFSMLVYHKIHHRECGELPSWVPDFGIPNKAGLERSLKRSIKCFPRFSAAGTKSTDESICEIDEDVLFVRGARVDVIEDGPKISRRRREKWRWKQTPTHVFWTLRYLAKSGKYPHGNGQSRDEAILWTWTADCVNSPELEDQATAYRDAATKNSEWFALWIASCFQRGDPTSQDWSRLESKLGSLQPRESLPTFEAVMKYEQEIRRRTASELLQSHPYSVGDHIKKGRSVYETKRGYLAFTTWQALPGDEVWIVRGCRTPVVLRRATDRDGYLILGQAYVHGIMNGEAMTEEFETNFARIALV